MILKFIMIIKKFLQGCMGQLMIRRMSARLIYRISSIFLSKMRVFLLKIRKRKEGGLTHLLI